MQDLKKDLEVQYFSLELDLEVMLWVPMKSSWPEYFSLDLEVQLFFVMSRKVLEV